jgi:hypothetical protein
MSNKQISPDRWVEFFDQFTNGNRGRLIKLEIVTQESGDEIAIQNAPLWSLVYDPVNKGNDLTIATGQGEVTYAHTILAPKTVWEAQDKNGKVVALEIVDQSSTQTILQLK